MYPQIMHDLTTLLPANESDGNARNQTGGNAPYADMSNALVPTGRGAPSLSMIGGGGRRSSSSHIACEVEIDKLHNLLKSFELQVKKLADKYEYL